MSWAAWAVWLTNGTVLLVADLGFCYITNAVLASKLGRGVVAEPATFLCPSSTGDGTDVPWRPGAPAPIDCKKMNHRPKLRPISKHFTFTGDSPECVQETSVTLTHGKDVWEEGESEMVLFVIISCCALQGCASVCFSRKQSSPIHDPRMPDS